MGGKRILAAMRSRKKLKSTLPIRSKQLSPTERRNLRSMKLDRLPVADAVTLMLSEEAKVTRALLSKQRLLAKGVPDARPVPTDAKTWRGALAP